VWAQVPKALLDAGHPVLEVGDVERRRPNERFHHVDGYLRHAESHETCHLVK
jgi:hypothetical protein